MTFDWNKEKNSINFLNNTKRFERTQATQTKYDLFLSNYSEPEEIYKNIIETKLPINNLNVYGILDHFTLRKNSHTF